MLHSLLALMFFQALIFVLAAMATVWAISLKMKNAGIVDIAWAALFSAVSLLYAFLGEGTLTRKFLFAGMVCCWSMRLAFHLYVRVMAQHPVEDARYAKIREGWGNHADGKFFLFFELQGILVILLSVPFAISSMNADPGIAPLEVVGFIVWIFSLLGESLSDRQLAAFKKDPVNKGKTCDVGLWKYSRHPNYFFEWLIWCGYFLYASASPYGWISVFCPALMYYLLTKVTGVPMAEEGSLKSRGDEYRAYQKRTNEFFPWFPRRV